MIKVVQLEDGRCMVGNSFLYVIRHMRARGWTLSASTVIARYFHVSDLKVRRGRVSVYRLAGRRASPDSKRAKRLTGRRWVMNWSRWGLVVVREADLRTAPKDEVLF